MRVLVCGGRGFTNQLLANKVLGHIDHETHIDVIIHGGAKGADRCGDIWAQMRARDRIIFPANWQRYKTAAGPIRNAMMLTESKPDLVVAFAGGAGTADMVRRAKAEGIKVIEVNSFVPQRKDSE